MAQSLAPPPADSGNRRVVAPSVERIRASLRFDLATQEGYGEATVEFSGGQVDGFPALDLRQEIEWLRLDGKPLAADDLPPTDLGGGEGAEMRVLDVAIEAGTRHQLEIGYHLATPACEKAEPIGWNHDGLRFDFWMSDLHPGRYLEMWVPAPLIHDRLALSLDIHIEGTDRPHTLIANTAGISHSSGRRDWSVVYPAHFTALSPMLVIAPSDEVEMRRSAVSLPGRSRSLGLVTARHADTDADLANCEADLKAWLTYLSSRYEPWVHGDTFWAVVWAPGRGMEYDGATTASVVALEHEVFHSWFGRGVKPARASDGWIDEAWTTWATTSGRAEVSRFASAELGLDEPPVELYRPHPWSRSTPPGAYTDGSRLFAGLAHLFGGADRLRAAMSDWYRVNAGGLVTTDGLAAHLKAWSGVDIGPWWARYVHGRS
ncbi:MAG: hypothetical protein JO337_00045 [Acidimicrobiales bacterium]|nr:hypothetical protein [Acidimicrobiales bacterium]